MDFMRMRAYGLHDTDLTSLKSILALSSNILSQAWQIVDSGQAELHVYSLATIDGKIAWQRHSQGYNAILSSQPAHDQSINFILKRPLRAQNFIAVLNDVADKVTRSEQIGFKKQG